MVSYLVVHKNPKLSVIIDKKAFEDIINTLPQRISDIKLNAIKTSVVFLQEENNVIISLDIKIAKEVKFSEKIKEIKNNISSHTLYLIGKNPSNIIINYQGYY